MATKKKQPIRLADTKFAKTAFGQGVIRAIGALNRRVTELEGKKPAAKKAAKAAIKKSTKKSTSKKRK